MRVRVAIAAGLLGAAAVPALGQERDPADNAAASAAPAAETTEQPVQTRPSRRDQIEGLIESLLAPRPPAEPVRPAAADGAEPGSATAVADPQTPPAGAGSPDIAAPAGTPTASPPVAQEPPAAPGSSAAAPAIDAALAGADDSNEHSVEGIAADIAAGSIAADGSPAAATHDPARFNYLWAFLAGIVLLALAALAAQQLARRARLARTRGALAVTPSLDPDGGAASITPLRFAGPSARIQVRLDEGAVHG